MARFVSLVPKQFLLLATVVFLFLNVFGLSFAMPMTADGHMHGCPFMGGTTVCQMNPFEHVSAWQSMFTATVSENVSALLLLLTIIILVWVANIFKVCNYPEIRAPLQHLRRSYFFRSPLQEAFSNGILNPKVF